MTRWATLTDTIRKWQDRTTQRVNPGILLSLFGVALSGYLIYRTLSPYSPEEIWRSMTSLPSGRIAAATVFAAGSYLCLTGFDTMAVRYVGGSLPWRKTALASFVALSVGHNVGFAALSTGMIRLRFYTRWGLRPGQVAKMILFCAVTVGLGLLTLASLAFLLQPGLTARIGAISHAWLMPLGIVCGTIVIAYPIACWAIRSEITVRDVTVRLPLPHLAVGQIVLGSVNFILVAACLHQLLGALRDVSYVETAAAYVIANSLAIASHSPGGLGVLEAVLLLMLGEGAGIGALLTFRIIYFLLPLVIGTVAFAASELGYRRQ